MRLLIDTLVALMLAGILGGIVVAHRDNSDSEATYDSGRMQLRDLQRQINLQASLKRVPINEFGWPMTVDPEWFADHRPDNPLLDDSRPWLEVATPMYYRLENPLDCSTADPRAAQFWYNPAKGIVRARVPAGLSDQASLDAYNRVNGTSLVDLYVPE